METEQKIVEKMRAAGQNAASVRAFVANYRKLVAGETGEIPEANIKPVETLPAYAELKRVEASAILSQTVVIKLNGGLGTSMGLDRAKSLLPVKDGLTFLDLIVRQVLHLRESGCPELRFLLMNSFSTSADTREFLSRYPALGDPGQLEFVQSMVPKIDVATLAPAMAPENPELEWCPPGHGDLYAALLGSGTLEALLADGRKFAFVSNSDNLGATPDPAILHFFAERDVSFLMEVTRRTEADRKGGHLAVRRADDRLLLRESAQCPEGDMDAFQDIDRHRFFNTNNLWIRLDRLRDAPEAHDDVFPLPLIRNTKTLDPKAPETAAVYQLETAMGAAIESFHDATALEVPRSRFAPVKKTSDLLLLRSDACELRDDWTLGLVPDLAERPPAIELDDAYKRIGDFERLVKQTPSLRRATALTVEGAVEFNAPVTCIGRVKIRNRSGHTTPLPAATYQDETVEVPENKEPRTKN